jgi:hypothetical protein
MHFLNQNHWCSKQKPSQHKEQQEGKVGGNKY